MKLLFSYLKKNFAVIGAFLFSFLLFTGAFYFYTLPFEPLLYAFALGAFVFGILFAARFSSYRRRVNTLKTLEQTLLFSETALPVANGALEQEYQKLLFALAHAREDLAAQTQKTLADMTDYYTLWAHQIKTPIAAMRLLLQSEGAGEDVAELSDQLFRIEEYVEMVLCYLRAENISADLVLRSVRLDAVVKACLKKVARPFFRKRIALQYKMKPLTVLTDEKWLSFVIDQLLSNALKYTEKGRISVSIEERTLVIEDTGIGIRAEDLPRLGERGFTGYNGHEDKKSTGIGLYLCTKILRNLSHGFRVSSEVGKGTRVCILFGEEEAPRE